MLDNFFNKGERISTLCRILSITLLIKIAALGPGLANQVLITDHTSAEGNLSAADGDISLPKVLSQNDVILYRRILALQKTGKWKAADRLIKRLENELLMGHVQFQRYMHPRKYRSRYRELKDWLARYADHPGAMRIYKLALRRRPKNHLMPRAPVRPSRIHGFADLVPAANYRSPVKRSKAQQRRVRQIKYQIRRNVRREILTVSEKFLDRREVKRLLDPAEQDDLLSRIAAGWFYRGNARKALAIAGPAAARSRKILSGADWVAGLSAWRLRDIKRAARHFDALAHSKVADDWNRAAGAYWAARVYLVDRQPSRVNSLLAMAAQSPRTFYGLIAARQLGVELDLQWVVPPLTLGSMAKVRNLPSARRAIALGEVGWNKLAEEELRLSYLLGDHVTGPGLLALAHRLDFPAMQMRIALGVRGKDNRPYDQALFPIPPWKPAKGFTMDRALIFAFMRQESGFNEQAKSPMGAIGLMQLMPRTASYVANDQTLRRRNKWKLYNPEYNLELGQKYLAYLLSDKSVKGDLFRLAVAYNAGPGNLRKWLRKVKFAGDPLLFIESIPWRESRLFVERVLTNFWIYRERLRQDTPSLDALATGRWPKFKKLDGETKSVPRNVEN